MGSLSPASSDTPKRLLHFQPVLATRSRNGRFSTTRSLGDSKPAQCPLPTVGIFIDPAHGCCSVIVRWVCLPIKNDKTHCPSKNYKIPKPLLTNEPIPNSFLLTLRPPPLLSLSPHPHPRESPIHFTRRFHSQPISTVFTPTFVTMDTYVEFTSLLSEPEGRQIPSNDIFDTPSGGHFDIPVNAEMDGSGLSCSLCIIC